jgi:beta-N-acetylhexosaminidase
MPPPDDARALAARLVCFGFDGLEVNAHCARMLDLGCGAVILFARNVESPAQVARLCAEMKRRVSPRKLLVMVDQEGGRVARFKEPHFTAIPSAETVGNAADAANAARVVGDVVGKECRAVNVDMTLAPVVDVNTNPQNVVIGNRAFGTTPNAVGVTASAFVRACQSRGVAACAKHWPGHGDTTDDTHAATAITKHGLKRLRVVEIPPFVDAVKAGVASVLVAHVRVPGMEAPSGDASENGTSKIGKPASRSAAVVGFLRERVGFGGVVMSDDMEMGALLNEEGGVGQCAVDGLRASVDLFLACHAEKTQLAVVDALRDAIESDATNHTRRAATDAAARLRVLADAFVDGADAADVNARALETSDRAGTTRERVGAPEDARRVRDACGTSPRL